MVREARDSQPRPTPTPTEAEQLAEELCGRHRPPRQSAPRTPDRGGLAEQDLVAAVAARPQRRDPRPGQPAVEARRDGSAAVVLRRQPRGLVRLVEQRPPANPRQHAAVLVSVGARVAPPQRGDEPPERARGGLARPPPGPAARRRPRTRGGRRQQQPEAPGLCPPDELVVRIPRRRRRVGQARPHDHRAHGVGAQRVDLVQRPRGSLRPEVEQLVLVLEDRLLVPRGRRRSRGGQADQQCERSRRPQATAS